MKKCDALPPRAASSFCLHPSSFAHSFRSAFTLTEILIVIGLIVLIIALAVPAFNLITGTRSVDAAENLVAAMLSQARAAAMDRQTEIGVAFFLDPDNDRTAMVFVSAPSGDDAGADMQGLEQYKGFAQTNYDGQAVTYKPGDVYYRLMPDGARQVVRKFVINAQGVAVQASAAGNDLDITPEAELQYLPAGVGAQLINNPHPPDVTSPADNDRYVRNGVIMFDRYGAVAHRAYTIPATDADGDFIPDNNLSRIMGRQANTGNIPYLPGNPTFTQLGVVLYDVQVFRTRFGRDADRLDPINDGSGVPIDEPVRTSHPTNPQPREEEWWLDTESLQLLINRYNGTLIRGE